jgi:hypothetical protein
MSMQDDDNKPMKIDTIELRRQKVLDAKKKAEEELQRLEEDEKQAALEKIIEDKKKKAELLAQADAFEADSREHGLAKEDVLARKAWAKEARVAAAAIVIEGEEKPELIFAEPVENLIRLNWLDRNRNALTTVVCLLLVGLFFGLMKFIREEDPEAIVYDSSAFQKVFLALSIFSILQLLKIFAVRLFYPMIYRFKNNRESPEFDFSKYFKEELTPLQQICVSLFISSFFSLEFIMLLQVKF